MKSRDPFYQDPRFVAFLRILVGLFFLYASFDKLFYPVDFSESIRNYRIMPEWSLNLLALTLPWIEFTCGLLLVCGVWVRSAAFLVSLMLLAFMAGLLSAIWRKLDIDCGCYHGASQDLFRRVVEDALLFWMSLYVLQKGPGYKLVPDSETLRKTST